MAHREHELKAWVMRQRGAADRLERETIAALRSQSAAASFREFLALFRFYQETSAEHAELSGLNEATVWHWHMSDIFKKLRLHESKSA